MKNDRFSPSLGVYVPELWAFRQKDSPACRELLEGVAILDLDGDRILASRGKRFESPLPDACRKFPTSRLLLSDNKHSLLLFPIEGIDARQTLVLSLPWSAAAVSRALLLLGRKDFSGLTRPGKEDPTLLSLLSELLFFLDRLLQCPDNLPLWTVVLRAANFAGCKLKRFGLSALDLTLTKEEIPLFFSLLLCFFLSVRKAGITTEVDLERTSPCCRVRFVASDGNENPAEIPKEPFLDCDAFRRFSLATTDEGHRLLLSLRRPGLDVSSGQRPRYIKLFLDCLP